jgi:hypothetical protein
VGNRSKTVESARIVPEGKNPDTEPLHTTELGGFVGKVLELTGALTEIPANAA